MLEKLGDVRAKQFDVRAHGRFGLVRVALVDGGENCGVLICTLSYCAGALSEMNQKRSDRSCRLRSSSVKTSFLAARAIEEVKFPVEQHHVLDVAQRRPMLGALQTSAKFGDVGIVGPFGRKPRDSNGSLISRTSMICSTSFRLTGFTITPLRGMTSTMPSIIKRSSAWWTGVRPIFSDRRELQFVDVFARPEGAGDDAVLDGVVGRIAQRSCRAQARACRAAAAGPASVRARLGCPLWRHQALARNTGGIR